VKELQNNKKVLVAMSGGVDSSVCACLLKNQGYELIGATMSLFSNQDIGINDKSKVCCSLSDVEDAKSICYKLDFTHFVFNFQDEFKKSVINRFVQAYKNGLTPNPSSFFLGRTVPGLKFTTPPPAGAAIDATYSLEYPFKTANNLLRFTYSIQLQRG
jgi:hypothetical protein